MASRTCAECGAKLDDNVKGTICLECELRKSDWQDFETHEYSRQELAAIPLGLHLGPLARVGALFILTILLLSFLGGLLGAMAGGDFGFGIGAFLGFSCGVAVSKFAWRLPTRDKCETLFARRKNTFVAGAVIFGVIGGLTGMVIPAAAKWTIDFGGGKGWAESGVAGRVIPGLIGLAVLGPIMGVAGASVLTFIRETSNKNSYLASFDEWRKTRHPKA